VFYEAVAGNRM